MNCLFSKDSFQWFFSKEDNKTDISKLEETEKPHPPKNSNIFRFFHRVFQTFLNNLCQIIEIMVHLKYTRTSLDRTLTKKSRFWLDWNLKQSFCK